MIYDLLENVNGSTNHSPGPRSGASLSAIASTSDEALLFGGLTRLTAGETLSRLCCLFMFRFSNDHVFKDDSEQDRSYHNTEISKIFLWIVRFVSL